MQRTDREREHRFGKVPACVISHVFGACMIIIILPVSVCESCSWELFHLCHGISNIIASDSTLPDPNIQPNYYLFPRRRSGVAFVLTKVDADNETLPSRAFVKQ